ncbi:MAG: hypothetical protein LZF62_310055 [Nitrospira sp.]|nr:MAG: hypothetical protein LZF62_310055 [Nitrospira sp.]
MCGASLIVGKTDVSFKACSHKCELLKSPPAIPSDLTERGFISDNMTKQTLPTLFVRLGAILHLLLVHAMKRFKACPSH